MNNSIQEFRHNKHTNTGKKNLHTSVSTATLLLTRSVVVIATAAEFALQMHICNQQSLTITGHPGQTEL